MNDLEPVMLAGFAATLVVAALIVLTRRWHGKFTFDETHGVQKLHHEPTSRIGGIAILAGSLVSALVANGELRDLLLMMTLCGAPAFAFGIAEDVTRRVSVRTRLLATMAAGLIFCVISGYSVNKIDVWGWDQLLAVLPVAWLFSAFAMGGVANSINIIDGLNGLSSGVLMVIFAGFALIASLAGDTLLTNAALILAAVTTGFFVFNYPFGKLFLGDAGAYYLGFMLASVAVMLPARNEFISPWVSLLLCAYPIVETVYSMWRRWRAGNKSGEPDRLHFHQIVFDRLSARGIEWAKPLASMLLWLLPGICILLTLLTGFETLPAIGGFLAFFVVYRLVYGLIRKT